MSMLSPWMATTLLVSTTRFTDVGRVDAAQHVAGAVERRLDQLLLRVADLAEQERRRGVDDQLAAVHRLGVAALVEQVGLVQGEPALVLGGERVQVLEPGRLVGIADGAADGVAVLEQVAHDPAGDVPGRSGDQHGLGRVDLGHVPPARVELATFRLGGGCSIH